jgi:hypothetical protein
VAGPRFTSVVRAENLDGQTAPVLPPNWTFDPGFTTSTTFSVSSPNSLRFKLAGSSGNAIYPIGDAYRGYVSGRCKMYFDLFQGGGEMYWLMGVRSNTAFTNAYYVQIEPAGSTSQGVSLWKVKNGATNQLGSTIGATQIATGIWYNVQLIANGTSLKVYVQRRSDNKYLDSGGAWTNTTRVACISTDSAVGANNGVIAFQGFTSSNQTSGIYLDDIIYEGLQASVRAATSANNGNGAATLTVTVDSSVLDGDAMIACVTAESGATITAPGGWTSIRSDTQGALKQQSWYRVAAGEPANYQWTFDTTRQAVGIITIVQNADTSASPVDVSGGLTGIDTNITCPSITTTQDGDLLLCYYGQNAQPSPLTPPVPQFKDAEDQTTGPLFQVAYCMEGDEHLAGAGATGKRTTVSIASLDWIGHALALKSLGAPPWDGTWGPSQFQQCPDPLANYAKQEVLCY